MTTSKFIISCCIFMLLNNFLMAQDSSKAIHPDLTANIKTDTRDSTLKISVSAIHIIGNKKTKNYIILREIPFKEGDSLLLYKLHETLEQARVQVYNINLFSEVAITTIIVSATQLSVEVTVREKWFIYPTPQIQFVDRNFNVWWRTYNADFKRVIYGVKFDHINFSGRSDRLRIYLLNGYSRNVSFSYNAPYSNSKLTEGFTIYGGYTQNKEIIYKTSDSNETSEFRKAGFVRNSFNAGISYQLRKGFFKRQFFTLGYTYVKVNDSVITADYNPNYFNLKRSSVGIIDLSYSFSYSNTNNNNFPLKGKTYAFTVLKRGLGLSGGINMLSLSGVYNKFLNHTRDWYSSVQLYSKIILPFKQPFINQRSIGYSEFYLRGLEYYVIDGVAAAVAKYTLRKKLLSFNINVPFNIKAVPRIPFTFYAKTYTDIGYSYIQKEFDTMLNNRFLYSGGCGIDLLTLYDTVASLEYSINQLGEAGIFLHAKVGF